MENHLPLDTGTKTQRVNLSWLEEQFKRKWYRLVRGPSMMQAADILTKPFTDAEKWNFAVNLLGHRNGISTGKTSKPNPHSKSQVTHTLPKLGGTRSRSETQPPNRGSMLFQELEA